MTKIENCEKALKKLSSFLMEPAPTEIMKAGVIQAFEYNFEVFWKAFKELAPTQGFEDPPSPRKAILIAFHLKIIENESVWVQMMKDRNNTSPVYNEDLANSIFERIKNEYKSEFESALLSMKNFTTVYQ